MYGPYALPVVAPAREDCDVCGAPAEFARIHDGATVGAWCGPACASGRRAADLRLGEQVAIWTGRFPEVRSWQVRAGAYGNDLLPIRGLARVGIVASVAKGGVTLANPGAAAADAEEEPVRDRRDHGPSRDQSSEQLIVPADFPCTRFTGITARPRRRRPAGHIVRPWPVHSPWVRDVTFGQWVSYQPQGRCEDSPDCDAPAKLWVSYRQGMWNSDDARSCENCLARRLRRRASAAGHGTSPPTPVAYWNPTLLAWDVRPHDGTATRLA